MAKVYYDYQKEEDRFEEYRKLVDFDNKNNFSAARESSIGLLGGLSKHKHKFAKRRLESELTGDRITVKFLTAKIQSTISRRKHPGPMRVTSNTNLSAGKLLLKKNDFSKVTGEETAVRLLNEKIESQFCKPKPRNSSDTDDSIETYSNLSKEKSIISLPSLPTHKLKDNGLKFFLKSKNIKDLNVHLEMKRKEKKERDNLKNSFEALSKKKGNTVNKVKL